MAVINPWDSGSAGGGVGGGTAATYLPSTTSGAPQSNAQSIWEAGANAAPGLAAPGNFASPFQLQGLGAGLPAGVGAYPAAPPAPSASASPQSAGTVAPGQPAAPQATATSPWLSNVTSTSMDGSVTPFASPGNPNINYINRGAAADIARRYGANLVSSGNVMGGSVSDPMYGLDFGAGDPMSAGQIAFWEQRGDTPEQIKSRLYQPVAWWNNVPGGAGYVNPNIVRNNDVNWNFSSPLATNLPVGGVNQGFANQSAAQSDMWKKALENAGDSAANLGNGGTVQIGTPPRLPQRNEAPQQLSTAHYDNPQMQSVMAFLSMLLGGGNVSSMLAQLFGGQGQTSRQPNLTNARNTAFQRNYFYPRTEPRLY